jgi:hypothetical protein
MNVNIHETWGLLALETNPASQRGRVIGSDGRSE